MSETKIYVKKETAYEDAKSTASTFLVIGILGIVALILIQLNVIPIHLSDYMKNMTTIVMGILFVIFTVVGIVYQTNLKRMKAEITTEATNSQAIMEWAQSSLDINEIDSKLDEELTTEETKYFARFEIIEQRLTEQFPNLNPSFQEYMMEEIYSTLYRDSEK